MLNPDFRDMLSALSDARARFLVVGAYAMAAHGYVRGTGDIDLWVEPSPDNADRVLVALRTFGAPTHGLTAAEFSEPGLMLQIGVPPHRIDVLTEIDGVDFERAWQGRREVALAGLSVPVRGRSDLIRNKEATGRPKDRLDADELRRLGGS